MWENKTSDVKFRNFSPLLEKETRGVWRGRCRHSHCGALGGIRKREGSNTGVLMSASRNKKAAESRWRRRAQLPHTSCNSRAQVVSGHATLWDATGTHPSLGYPYVLAKSLVNGCQGTYNTHKIILLHSILQSLRAR